MPLLTTSNWRRVMGGLEKVRGIAQVAHTLDVADRMYVVKVMLNCATSWEELEAVSRAVENAKKRKSIQDTRNMRMLKPVGLGFVQPCF
jgi:hypothetical protein